MIALQRTLKRKQGETLVADLFVEHELAIAEVFITVRHKPLPVQETQAKRWLTFDKPVVPGGPIPDGYFEIETAAGVRCHFLEVDLGTETLKVWQKKIMGYLHIAASGEFSRRFGQQQFRVLVVMTSERRLGHLRLEIAKNTAKIFWLTTFELINRDGFWSAIWLRPTGDLRQRLLKDTYALLHFLPPHDSGRAPVLQFLRTLL